MTALKTYPQNKILKTHHVPHILLLVADANEATLYSCRKSAQGVKLTRISSLQAEPIEFQDEPGRSVESVGSARHAIAPHTDPKQDNRQNFTRDIAKRLNEEFGKNGFENLVLIAPPKVLGDLRPALGEVLQKALIAEAAKELVKVPEKELANYLNTNQLV